MNNILTMSEVVIKFINHEYNSNWSFYRQEIWIIKKLIRLILQQGRY